MRLIYGHLKNTLGFALIFSLLLTAILPANLKAQNNNPAALADFEKTALPAVSDVAADKHFDIERDFRVEKLPVAGGAELVTIFARLKGLRRASGDDAEEVPLVSVLRDTLGDDLVENDRLRYVWMLSYAKPSVGQRIASAIPFLYARTGGGSKVGTGAPPALVELNSAKSEMWNKIFGFVFTNLILDNLGMPVRATREQYQTNAKNHRHAAIARALAVFALYESIEGEKILSPTELRDVQSRMKLSGSLPGAFVGDEKLGRVYQKTIESTRSNRGANWELLRQYSERQGLIFEPLEMPDGSATHALVWVAAPDLTANRGRSYDGRFLNIKNPWNDARLLKWKGYKETRWFDAENRQVEPETPGAKAVEMIPLALYGLDNPKIPTILVDFRDALNPKKREMSRRVLEDVTGSILAVSKFGNLPYFVGRFVYSYVTQKRGMDVNQASRLRSYSQLKLLLALNASLEPDFRDEISRRLEKVSLNPLENDLQAEAEIARRQYENLMNWARRPDGLAARVERDRRLEMARLTDGGAKRMLYSAANALSLGLYTRRVKATPERRAALDVQRQLEYHERFLLETAQHSAQPEIDGDIERVRRSLAFVAENGDRAQKKTARAVSKIFRMTADERARELAIKSLYRINNAGAKKELLAVYNDQKTEARWREMSGRYLKMAEEKARRVPSPEAKTILEIGAQ